MASDHMRTIRRFVFLGALVAAAMPASAQAVKAAEPPFTGADVEFMNDMMHHHAQAIEMCDLATDRAGAAVRTFCKRVHVSQQDEIETMSKWLKVRKQEVPEVLGHHHGGMEALDHAMMPGMMSPAQMRELAQSSGAPFDRLLLQGMIHHHEGALTMVKKLFDTSGAGQGSELFSIASGIEVDQRADIDRMKGMLATAKP